MHFLCNGTLSNIFLQPSCFYNQRKWFIFSYFKSPSNTSLHFLFKFLHTAHFCSFWCISPTVTRIFLAPLLNPQRSNTTHSRFRFMYHCFIKYFSEIAMQSACLSFPNRRELSTISFPVYTDTCKHSILTHWPLGDLNVTQKREFSILFYWLVSSDLLMIVPSDECHRTQLTISQH